MNKLLLHIEGFMVLLLSIGYYSMNDFNWWLFFLLLFVPDISMIGYMINNSIGATLYNYFHTYTIAFLFIILGLLTHTDIVLSIGIIWTAHIGMDRALGYGLKYSTSFKSTHMQRI